MAYSYESVNNKLFQKIMGSPLVNNKVIGKHMRREKM